MPNLLKVRLSLRGRPIRSYTFNQARISIGRDPESDVFLDNTGISREHAIIERTPGGYMVEDLGSANGTFLNEQPVRKDYVGQDDVIQIGKFALWMGVESDRRESAALGKRTANAMEGTMVIDPDSLLEMQRKSRTEIQEEEPEPVRAASAATTPAPEQSGSATWWPLTAAFLAGAVVGAVVTTLIGG